MYFGIRSYIRLAALNDLMISRVAQWRPIYCKDRSRAFCRLLTLRHSRGGLVTRDEAKMILTCVMDGADPIWTEYVREVAQLRNYLRFMKYHGTRWDKCGLSVWEVKHPSQDQKRLKMYQDVDINRWQWRLEQNSEYLGALSIYARLEITDKRSGASDCSWIVGGARNRLQLCINRKEWEKL